MKPIKLSELIESLEFDSDEHVTKIDLQAGRAVMVERWLLDDLEAGDEAALQDLPKWQQEEVETARAIVEDSGERFLDAPDKFDFHESREMERFIQGIEDAAAADQLWRAIKGKGAFRCFKDTASRLGLLDQWYRYRDGAMREFVIAWAEVHKIPVVGDTKP